MQPSETGTPYLETFVIRLRWSYLINKSKLFHYFLNFEEEAHGCSVR